MQFSRFKDVYVIDLKVNFMLSTFYTNLLFSSSFHFRPIWSEVMEVVMAITHSEFLILRLFLPLPFSFLFSFLHLT